MESQYVVAFIPVVCGYLAWMTSMAIRLSQSVSAIQSKQDSLIEEHNYLRARVDALSGMR